MTLSTLAIFALRLIQEARAIAGGGESWWRGLFFFLGAACRRGGQVHRESASQAHHLGALQNNGGVSLPCPMVGYGPGNCLRPLTVAS